MRLDVLALLIVPLALSICNDKNPSCGHWAKDDHCTSNPEVNRLHHLRHRPTHLVPVLIEGAPLPQFMKRMCPRSCGICNHTCADTNEACTAWALAGEVCLLQKR